MNGNWNIAHNSPIHIQLQFSLEEVQRRIRMPGRRKSLNRRSLPKTGLFRLAKMGLKKVNCWQVRENNAMEKMLCSMLCPKNGQLWNVKDDISAELLDINVL